MTETSKQILKIIFYDTTAKGKYWLVLVQVSPEDCQGEYFFGLEFKQGFSKNFSILLHKLFRQLQKEKNLTVYSCEICPESVVDYTHLLVRVGDEGGQLYEKIAQVI